MSYFASVASVVKTKPCFSNIYDRERERVKKKVSVFVLDDSFSTGTESGGEQRLETVKGQT